MEKNNFPNLTKQEDTGKKPKILGKLFIAFALGIGVTTSIIASSSEWFQGNLDMKKFVAPKQNEIRQEVLREDGSLIKNKDEIVLKHKQLKESISKTKRDVEFVNLELQKLGASDATIQLVADIGVELEDIAETQEVVEAETIRLIDAR